MLNLFNLYSITRCVLVFKKCKYFLRLFFCYFWTASNTWGETVATDDPVARCGCKSVTWLLCADTVEQVGVLFRTKTLAATYYWKTSRFLGGFAAHWLAEMLELVMCAVRQSFGQVLTLILYTSPTVSSSHTWVHIRLWNSPVLVDTRDPYSDMLLSACQMCCEQVLFLAVSVCLSVHTKSRKLLVGDRCNFVGICVMVNAWSGWKLVIFDLDLFS